MEHRRQWEELGERPSWYLDPLVARQKRRVHQRLVRDWGSGASADRVLKTDLFEEAHGEDQILSDLLPEAALLLGFDIAVETVRRAKARIGAPGRLLFAGDVRQLGLADGSIDLIISNSTLDHFEKAESFQRAVSELARVLRPGGVLVVTVDNPYNPLYPLLKWASRRGWTPFRLGHTVSSRGLARDLASAGLEVTGSATLIHNPRMVSTLLFLGVRRLLGRHGDSVVRLMLWLFEQMERLPTRRFTACFLAARARKPAAKDGLASSR